MKLYLIACAAPLLVFAACSDTADENVPPTTTSAGEGGTTTTDGGTGGQADGGGDFAGGAGGGELSCPEAIDFEIIGAASEFDTGFTGLGHGAKQDGGRSYRLELYDCDDECRRCKVRGPIDAPDPGSSQKRCYNDFRSSCTVDADCAVHGGPAELQACRYMSAQLNNVQGGFPACLFVSFEPDEEGYSIEGTFDLATGDTTFSRYDSIISGTIGAFCQNCEGDISPNDGTKDGTCASTGEACDVNVLSGGFQFDYALSYDCMLEDPMNPGNLGYAAVSLPSKRRDVSSTERGYSLSADSPDCGAPGFEGQKCYCGVCEGTPFGCFSNDDCGGAACVSGGFPTKPNDCADACTYDALAGRHYCTNGSGMTVGCYPTEEPLPIPGSNQNQGDFYSLELGAISCIGTTGTSADQVAGLPGVLRTVEVIRATVVE